LVLENCGIDTEESENVQRMLRHIIRLPFLDQLNISCNPIANRVPDLYNIIKNSMPQLHVLLTKGNLPEEHSDSEVWLFIYFLWCIVTHGWSKIFWFFSFQAAPNGELTRKISRQEREELRLAEDVQEPEPEPVVELNILDVLPASLLKQLLKHLSFNELKNLRLVCSQLNTLARDISTERKGNTLDNISVLCDGFDADSQSLVDQIVSAPSISEFRTTYSDIQRFNFVSTKRQGSVFHHTMTSRN
jgi:hypothetical protein